MMLVSLFLAFFLPCVGMSAVFVIYIILLWYASARSAERFGGEDVEKVKTEEGLSKMELEKMGSVVVDEQVKGRECAVCLDDLEVGQVVRSLPDCHHGFHVECADAWLSKHRVCPLCRAKLEVPTSTNSPPTTITTQPTTTPVSAPHHHHHIVTVSTAL